MIDEALVHRLLASQFPQWKDLAVRQTVPGGWDNRTFRLGEDMLVRMPSAAEYAEQVEKEHRWLPRLAPLLPLSIPEPLAMGEPGDDYPWKWSIYRWLEGEPATTAHIVDTGAFTTSVAEFLIALQRIDSVDGPVPGNHNFYRGGLLTTYDAETRKALSVLKNKIDVNVATEVWEEALASAWQNPPVWVHGDISPGNLLMQEGCLSAVIDFGMLAVGDPACDLAIAWTVFKDENRNAFRDALLLDGDTWGRGRGWALWKAMIIAAGLMNANTSEYADPWRIIDEVLEDHRAND